MRFGVIGRLVDKITSTGIANMYAAADAILASDPEPDVRPVTLNKYGGGDGSAAMVRVELATLAARNMVQALASGLESFFKPEDRQAVPNDLDVRLVVDDYAAHKTPVIRRWLLKRQRWHVRRTSTRGSWIAQVERLFALLFERQIKRGAHHSVAALQAAITSFIDVDKTDHNPFQWTKTALNILASIECVCPRISASCRGP